MRQKSRVLAISKAAVVLVLLTSGAMAQERWFHVQVNESGSDPVEVMVNLPLTLIEKALEILPEEVHSEVEMGLNDAGFRVEDLRELWQEVRASEDATFVTVESESETVRVAKDGAYFVAETVEMEEGGAEVDVRFPFEVVDALFSGEEDRLDLAAAVRALAEHGDGDMVTVRDGETRVRVWVDGQNEPTR